MSGVSSSTSKKTAIPESQTPTANSSQFGTAIKATPQKLASRTKIEKKPENTINMNGITMPRQPTQQSMTEYYSSEQAANLFKNIPLTVYVIDNYQNKKFELLGYDKLGNGVGSSHDAVAANIANAVLHGKAKIERLDVSTPNGQGWDNSKIKQSLVELVKKEAKLQNRTIETVNLSHIAVNLSLGGGGMATPEFSKLIKAITDRGGHVFQSAGNQSYSKQASLYKNITVVDASDREILGTTSQNPTCSIKLNNLCETPDLRKIDPSASNIIAPQRIITRATIDGKIERRDHHSSTGWSPFIDNVDTSKINIDTPKGLNGETPSSISNIQQVQDFLDFKANLYEKNPTYIRDKLVENKIITELRSESERRFGKKAMIPIEFLGLLNKMELFDGSENKLSVTIPNGIKPENILVPFDRSLFRSKNIGTVEKPITGEYHVEHGEIPYYILDKDKKMKLITPTNAVMSDGTSWATPYALAETELGYRVQIEKASSKAKP